MQRILRVVACLVVALGCAAIVTRANENELEIHKRQVVVTNVIANCGAGTLTINGHNFGESTPYVTLNLQPLGVARGHTPEMIVAELAAAQFCVETESYLLTVMRTRPDHPKHRFLKPSKLDLATFDVTVVGKDAVTTNKIKDGEVMTADLADGAVTAAKLAEDMATQTELDEHTHVVTGADIQDLSVTGTDIADHHGR